MAKPFFEHLINRKLHPQLLVWTGSRVWFDWDWCLIGGSDGDGNADLDASYDKEESFSKDEDLESPRAKAFWESSFEDGHSFFLWEVGKFQAIAKGVGDRISFCVYWC